MVQWLAHLTSNQGDAGSIPTQLVVRCRYLYTHYYMYTIYTHFYIYGSEWICEKVPTENCRVLSKMRPKHWKFNSHWPVNRTEATAVTQLLRRRGGREEEERKERDFKS